MPDGSEIRNRHRVPYWFMSTIDAWRAEMPSSLRAARNPSDGQKVCSRCNETKPLSAFGQYTDKRQNRPQATRYHAKCHGCRTQAARDWNAANPELHAQRSLASAKRNRRRRRAKSYGLTEIELAALEAAQQGICLICREFAEDGLVIDHDHETGAVRGLLCTGCNVGLGAFRDDPRRLAAAIIYLRKGGRGVFAEPDRESPSRVA